MADVQQLPELRVENRRVSDPANAHRRNQANPNIHEQQQPQQQHFLPLRQIPRTFNQLPNQIPNLVPQRNRPRNTQTAQKRLDTRLRTELPCHVAATQWPIAQPHILNEILTSDEIVSLFREYQDKGKLPREEDIEALCRKVRGDRHPSCVVVLAMLILADKGFTIGEVLRDQVFDDKLPLIVDNHSDPVLFFWDRSVQTWRQPECFDDDVTWGTQAKLDICKWQWYLQVPYMEVVGPEFQAYEDVFQPDVIFPWSSLSKDGEVMRDNRTEGYGGYSAVYKRHIDDRFHGFHDILQEVSLE